MDWIIDTIKLLISNGFDLMSIIVGFLIAIAIIYWKDILRHVMKRADIIKLESDQRAEMYAINSAVKINDLLSDIINKDKNISNVILCNYHNGASSDSDFSYYYFTSISEGIGNTTNQCIDIWREKSYINYQPELKYIHQNRSAIIDTTDEYDLKMFPKLSKLVIDSMASVALIVPISGIGHGIGFIVIMYNEHKTIDDRGDYLYNITPELEQIAVLLDYKRHKKNKKK